jgi:DNA repair protein RecN (Recombination protein N)
VLTRLNISNFTIIDQLEVSPQTGMTVITGETGAGKSIIVDALSLALGGRADPKAVRPSASHADISAVFDVSHSDAARIWLGERKLQNPENECRLRRIVNVDGRSRAYINDRSMPLKEVQIIAQQLAAICGQHAHYAMLDSRMQRVLLDQYAGCEKLSTQVRQIAEEWAGLLRQLSMLRQGGSGEQQCELLRYQIRDIEALQLDVAQISNMEEEYNRQAAADELINWCRQTQALTNDEDGSNGKLRQAVRLMGDALTKDDRLQEAYEHLYTALQHSDEAARALERYGDDFDIDPQRFQELELKFNELNRIAKLHGAEPADLPNVCERLKKDLDALESNMELLENGDQRLADLETRYQEQAGELSTYRANATERLNGQINETLAALEMSHCRFEAVLNAHEDQKPSAGGKESIKYMASTNPGYPAGPLEKIASGGELSRISLALQVAVLGMGAPQCMVFDEVDSGVSSNAAHQVGNLLANLGKRGQTLCVTHLAQVVGFARQHWVVIKETQNERTLTRLRELRSDEERVEEMARIMSGQNITDQARAHARELLQS